MTNTTRHPDWTKLRNLDRRTPWNLTERGIERELNALDELRNHGLETPGDRDRRLDLEDEIARRNDNND